MKIAIIISSNHRSTEIDVAGENIKNHLLAGWKWEVNGQYDGKDVLTRGNISMYTVNNECIHHEGLDESIHADLFLFATTHSSASGVHSLSVHPVGNFADALLGGQPQTLGYAHAGVMKALFMNLHRLNTLEFATIMEATHHGPAMKAPVVFIEIGSDVREWGNKEAGRIVAHTIMETLEKEIPVYTAAIGIGGPHHTPHFTRVLLGNTYSIGHVCPKYNLDHLTADTLAQMMEKTVPKPAIALLDWKGLGSHKDRVVALLDQLAIPYEKTKAFKEHSAN